jgi:cardiolipin synthase A/B
MQEIWQYVGWAFAATWIVLALFAASHAMINKRDPRSAALWVLISATFPMVGPWLYWALGINRVERKAIRKLGRRGRPFDAYDSAIVSAPASYHELVAHLHPLRTVADRVARLPLLEGNTVEPLHNGEQTYPRMLAAIAGARNSITMASYIFDYDDVGKEFARAMGAAARRGVVVYLLVDGIGALGNFSRIGRMLLKSGAKVTSFVPLTAPFGRIRLNLRNHRKMMVVDGRLAYVGGINISARHLLTRTHDPKRVEDLHFELTGPVVAEIQHTFSEDWALANDEVLAGDIFFPRLEPTGNSLCRGIASGPDEDFEINHWMYAAAFASAQKSIHVMTPYFVPTSPLLMNMTMAALRGVEVKLWLPSVVDIGFLKWVADAYLQELLEKGVRVFRFPPPFVHTKLMIVDERWCLFGSANMDPRSLRLNFEFNVEAYDPVLASNLHHWLEGRIANTPEITLEWILARSKLARLRDGALKMFSPHL